jgi:hypothetical protein
MISGPSHQGVLTILQAFTLSNSGVGNAKVFLEKYQNSKILEK